MSYALVKIYSTVQYSTVQYTIQVQGKNWKTGFDPVGELAEYGFDQQRLIWYAFGLWGLICSFRTFRALALHRSGLREKSRERSK